MLHLHSPKKGHYPLLLVNVWQTVVSWYKVAKQFNCKIVVLTNKNQSHQGGFVDRADQKRF